MTDDRLIELLTIIKDLELDQIHRQEADADGLRKLHLGFREMQTEIHMLQEINAERLRELLSPCPCAEDHD